MIVHCGIDPGQKLTTVSALVGGETFFFDFEQPNQYSILQVVNHTRISMEFAIEQLKTIGDLTSVAVESPALSARGQSFAFGAVYSTVLQYCCTNFGLTFFVAPVKLKYAVTGSGKAKKPDILRAVKKDLKIDLKGDHNKADALSLAHISKAGYHIINGEQYNNLLGREEWVEFILSNNKEVKGKKQGILHRPGELFWRLGNGIF